MVAVQLDPKGLWDYLGRGWAYGRSRDLKKAIANLTHAIIAKAGRETGEMLSIPSSMLYTDRGVFHYLNGNCESAIEVSSAAIRLAPRDFDAYASRGYYYLASGDPDKAIADENYALHIEGGRPGTHDILARAYVAKGEAAKALDEANKGAAMEPKSSRAHAVAALPST